MGPAISGQKGHNRTYQAARIIWNDFGLDENEGYPILESFNATCEPPWSEKELRHKWDDAVKVGTYRVICNPLLIGLIHFSTIRMTILTSVSIA